MSATGPIHPRRDDGSPVDATFELSPVPWFEITYHHKAGGRDSPRSVNADYHEGLELLLSRLASVRAKILGISVDSGVARALAPDDRELDLDFPIDLAPTVDCAALRLEITRAQKSVGRRPDAKSDGGNDQKRILITVGLYARASDYEDLRTLLVGDVAEAAPPRATGDLPGESASPPGPRRKVPKVRDLVDAGFLPVGTRLYAEVAGETVAATLVEGVNARLDGEEAVESLARLTDRVAGHSESAMRMWTVLRDGRRVPLHMLRDRLAASAEWVGQLAGGGRDRVASPAKTDGRGSRPGARPAGDRMDKAAARRFIESIPPGCWTAYKDVASAAGAPKAAQAIGQWLAREGESVANVWRVMTNAGVPSAGWRAAGPGIPKTVDEVRARLSDEGVRFVSGAADPDQRWHPSDELVDP